MLITHFPPAYPILPNELRFAETFAGRRESLYRTKSKRSAVPFQQVYISGSVLAMKLQLKPIDQQRSQHPTQIFIFDREQGIP